MSKHTMSDLYQMQGMSLDNKVKMTKRRIQEWVDEFGLDGVYVSFSGGKDSTVLLTLARQMYGDVIKGVFVDTGLEYPEIRQFVKQWDNIDWIKPKMTFKAVIEKYGYPFISKEVAECVYGARKYLTSVIAEMDALDRQTDRQTDRQRYAYRLQKLCGQGVYAKSHGGGYDNKYRKLRGLGSYSSGKNLLGQADMGSSQVSRTPQNVSGGGVRRFSDLMGIRAIDNSIDSRLWQGYRQSTDTNPDGDIDNPRESNDGDYP